LKFEGQKMMVAFILLGVLVSFPVFCDFAADVEAVRKIAQKALGAAGGSVEGDNEGSDDGFDD
jgi:hypothetical protein